jgi:hypothetical protein
MTCYYLQVLEPNLSICLDSDVNFYHHYEVGDVIKIHMYSDKGPKVPFGHMEYNAEFTHCWDSYKSNKLTVASVLKLQYMVDITKMVERNNKLSELGI